MADDKRKKIVTEVKSGAAHAELFPLNGTESQVPEQYIEMVPYRRIVELPGMNPRTEGWGDDTDIAFAESIRASYESGRGIGGSGFLQPLGGTWHSEDLSRKGSLKPEARVVLVWGGRRKWTVEYNIKHHGWTTEHLLPFFIQAVGNAEAFNMAFDENYWQKPQTPWDTAVALERMYHAQKLIDKRLGYNALAKRLGKKDEDWVRRHLVLLKARAIPELWELYDGTEKHLTPIRWLMPVDSANRKRIARMYKNGEINQKQIVDEKRKAGYGHTDSDEPGTNGSNGSTPKRIGTAPAKGMAIAPSVDIEAYLSTVSKHLGTVQDALASLKTQGAKPPLPVIRKWRAAVRDVQAQAQKIDESL